MVDETDKKVIRLLQGDIPLDPRPFKVMAERIGLSEQEFLQRTRRLRSRGVIRRFGATLRHQEAGFGANAMVAWSVPEERIDKVGKTLAGFREVTHCYERRVHPRWPYNLYTMVHAETEEDCRRLVEKMARQVEIEDFLILISQKEFKKTSMQYF